jgi:hypothetical protein
MGLSSAKIEHTTYHFGRSIGGYTTRLFLKPEDAIHEEGWLDAIWRQTVALWKIVEHLTQADRERHVRATVEALMDAAKKGLRPVVLPEDRGDVNLFRSDGFRDAPRILVIKGAKLLNGMPLLNEAGFLGELNGESYDEVEDELDTLLTDRTVGLS